MKKNDWIFLGTVLVYSLLFYKQMPGLNFLLMNIIMIIGTLAMDRKLLYNRNWIFSAIGALCSSLCVYLYGDLLSILANFISILMMSAFAMNPKNSVITSIFQSFLSVLTSFAFMIDDGIKRKKRRMESNETSAIKWNRVAIVFGAIVVAVVFFILYRQSNTLFLALTDKIDWSFISPGWIAFTAVGFFVFYGYYYHHSVEQLSEWEGSISLRLLPTDKVSFFDSIMSVNSEKFSAIILLIMLNIMTGTVNFLDLTFIFSSGKVLPDGASYSEYVHQGVGALIFSIICAMAIILYYFRGRMNFVENSRPLRVLALLWILQNAVMVISTMSRTSSYVRAYGLTYMRIGLYVYLVLVLIGLITTAWKVYDKRSNAFLFKANSWLFYMMFIIAGFVNWDAFITRYNLSIKQQFDVEYFNDLSFRNYDQVVQYYRDHKGIYLDDVFTRKLYLFMQKEKYVEREHKWPSSVLAASDIYDKLKDQELLGQYGVYSLDLENKELKSIEYFPMFSNVHYFDAHNNDLHDLGDVGKFRNLLRLDVSGNKELTSIDGIQNCTDLEVLTFDADHVKDFTPLYRLSNLKTLNANHLPDDVAAKMKKMLPDLSIDTHLFSEYWR